MLDALDEGVGRVFAALENADMLRNTVLVFSSDNGGIPWGFHGSRGFNWPLRGVKNTLWEGGVRSSAFLWSPLLRATRRVSHQLMHISDWLPTLYAAAGQLSSNVVTLYLRAGIHPQLFSAPSILKGPSFIETIDPIDIDPICSIKVENAAVIPCRCEEKTSPSRCCT